MKSEPESLLEPTHSNSNALKEEEDEEESAGDGTTASQQVLHGLPLALCLLATSLCLFLNALDQTLVATILSLLGNKFGDFGKISWVVSGFMLPSCVLAMSWGKIALIFGRKYTMLVSIFLFEAGSLVCALSNSMNMMIGGRVLAGVGGGGIQIMVFLIGTEVCPIQKRGALQGVFGSVFGISSVVGPLIGGAFAASSVTWRFNFYINLPIGGVAAVAIWWLFNPPIPAGTVREKLAKIDYIGTFLLTAGLVLVLLALTFGSTDQPWNSALIISFFVVGGLLVAAYLAYNFSSLCKNPMIPWEVVKIPQVIAPCLVMLLLFWAFIAANLYLATYFQVVWGMSPLKSGIQMLPLILSLVIFSIASGIAVSATRMPKPFGLVGTAIAAIGMGLMTMLDQNSSNSAKIGLLILPGVGVGCLMQSIAMCVQVAAPKAGGGVLIATTLIGFSRALGGVMGSAIGQTIQSVVFMSDMSSIDLPADVDPVALLNSPELIYKLPSETSAQVINAFVSGFQKVMYMGVACFIAGFILSIFFTNKKIPQKNTKPQAKDEEEGAGSEKEKHEDPQMDADTTNKSVEADTNNKSD